MWHWLFGPSKRVEVHSDMPSLRDPSVKSVLSEPFDKYGTPEALFDFLLRSAKRNMERSDDSPVKGFSLDKDDGDHFETTVEFDGLKLSRMGTLSPNEPDRLLKNVYKVDASNLSYYVEVYDLHKDRELLWTIYWWVSRTTSQLEVHAITPSGERKAGPFLRQLSQGSLDGWLASLD